MHMDGALVRHQKKILKEKSGPLVPDVSIRADRPNYVDLVRVFAGPPPPHRGEGGGGGTHDVREAEAKHLLLPPLAGRGKGGEEDRTTCVSWQPRCWHCGGCGTFAGPGADRPRTPKRILILIPPWAADRYPRGRGSGPLNPARRTACFEGSTLYLRTPE